jgi:hypothetical protein
MGCSRSLLHPVSIFVVHDDRKVVAKYTLRAEQAPQSKVIK